MQVRGLNAVFFSYSHSFMLTCRGDNPVVSSLGVGFDRLVTESFRVTSRGCLGQFLRQIRKLFRNRALAVSFLSRGQKRKGFWSSKPLEMDAKTVDFPLPHPFSKVNRSQRLYYGTFSQVIGTLHELQLKE